MHARQVAVTRGQSTLSSPHRGCTAVDAAAASAVGVSSGDRVRVLLPDRQHAATVVGTVGFGRLDGLASGARVLFDTATATDLLGGDGYAEIVVDARGRHRGDAPPAGRRRGRQGRDGAGCDAGRAA